MKQFTKIDFDVIYSQLRGCETVAGYLVENLEKIPFADLRDRLENLRDLIDLVQNNLMEKAQETEND